MASKAKAKALADDFDDNEVASMLEHNAPTFSDPEQWINDENGDLDWTYTARIVRTWSHDALLTHLWKKTFHIPPREYNPSAPFVWVQLHSGEIVILPHGYRLPLMFVAKYRWEITLSKVVSERTWKKERANIFHLSRLCENLFRRARAKSSRGGMEKGWRCLMFDRLLARFYKHWAQNDPQGIKDFLTIHGAKEYDRDVLKHDWKRWCLRGLNGVKMTEDEVTNGIRMEGFRKGLHKTADGIWMLGDRVLSHITDDQPLAGYSSTSDLTDFSPDEHEDISDSDAEVEGADTTIVDASMQIEFFADVQHKRPRESSTSSSDELIEREPKRSRTDTRVVPTIDLDDFPYSKNTHIGSLNRTLFAMSRHPVWKSPRTGRYASPHPSQVNLELNSDAPAVTAPSGPSGVAPTTDMAPPPPPPAPVSEGAPDPVASASHPQNGPAKTQFLQKDPPVPPETTSLTIVDSAAHTTSTRRVPVRHLSQEVEADGSSRLEPIYIPTASFFTSDRADKYPWPPALGPNESRTQSETRMFQECTSPDPLDSGEGITWRAAGTLGWGDEKAWQAAAQAATCEEALGLAQAAASTTSRPSRAASMKSRQLTKAVATQSKRNILRTSRKGKAPEKDKDAGPVVGVGVGPLESASASITFHRRPRPAAASSSRLIRAPSPALSQSSVSSLSSTPASKRVATPVNRRSNGQAKRRASTANTANLTSNAAGGSGTAPQGALHAKALELLVNLLDVKQVLQNTAGAGAAAGSSSAAAGTSAGAAASIGALTSKSAVEKALLEDRFLEIDGRFTTMKEELAGIVGRLQVLETLAEAEKGGRLAALRQEEEEGEEEEERREVEPWDAIDFGDLDFGGGMQEGMQVEGGVEEEGAEAGHEEAEVGGVEGKVDENAVEKQTESDQDVLMDEVGADQIAATAVDKASAANVEPLPRTLCEISIQTEVLVEATQESHPSRPPSTAPEEIGAQQSSQSTDAGLEQPQNSAQVKATPTPSSSNSPKVQLRNMDARHTDARQADSSEPDTDITMVNASAPSAASISALMKEELPPLDPRTRDMSSNLSLLVDSLVSAKMLAVMEGMVKVRVADKEREGENADVNGKDGKEKEKEKEKAVKEDSVASSSSSAVDAEGGAGAASHPLLADNIVLTNSKDSYAVVQLFDEIRTLQKDALLREQREKEELQAMRELHSAEVDALRRRLSYLETQQRLGAGSVSQPSTPAENGLANSNYAGVSHQDVLLLPRFQHLNRSESGAWPMGRQKHASYNGEGEDRQGQSSESPVESTGVEQTPGSTPTPTTKEPPVRIYTDRNFVFRKTVRTEMGKQREDDVVPLPIKSQRKHHLSFPRAPYG